VSAQSRKHRGYQTQRLLADRWVENGLFPGCYPIGAGESGSDIQRTPGLEVEVKARGDNMSLPAAIRQARARAGGNLPVVVWRHPGQGPAAVGDWTVTMRLEDFEELWRGATEGG
jgi:hypothetical protein